jgi:deoxyribonuclease-4
VRIGAHVRRGHEGTGGAIEECRIRGADAAQIFVSNPRSWSGPRVSDADGAAFHEAWSASGLGPLTAHAPYLVNIASPNPEFLNKSRLLATETVRACEALGVDLLVLHAGAGGPAERETALARAAETLRIVTGEADRVRVLVELLAGTNGAVASTISEAQRLLEAAGVERLGLCLDTCHLFAAGYGLDTPEGVGELFAELASADLTSRVTLIHANDSMYERGAHRDRHENVGDGFIGIEGWRALLARPELADLTLILETPGDAERHARDITTLRALALQATEP